MLNESSNIACELKRSGLCHSGDERLQTKHLGGGELQLGLEKLCIQQHGVRWDIDPLLPGGPPRAFGNPHVGVRAVPASVAAAVASVGEPLPREDLC